MMTADHCNGPNILLVADDPADVRLIKTDVREVLAEKLNSQLMHIPLIVLTCSQADEEILNAYNLAASCYVTKPVHFVDDMRVVKSIQAYWLTFVQLPLELAP